MNNIKNFLEQLKIYDVDMTKIRIGNQDDGGYVALKELCEQTSAVYSFGIGDDVGFELDFASRFPNTKFNLFDPTISKLPLEHSKFRFCQSDICENFKAFNYTPSWHFHNCLLKIDVEYNEWEALSILDKNILGLFNQILIEFHIVHAEPRSELTPYFSAFYQTVFEKVNEDLFAKYCKVLEKLNEQFYIFHIHPNNSLSQITVGTYTLPPLLEVSFVRKDLVKDVQETTASFPIKRLDFPNKTDRPDILGWYKFNSHIKG